MEGELGLFQMNVEMEKLKQGYCAIATVQKDTRDLDQTATKNVQKGGVIKGFFVGWPNTEGEQAILGNSVML